MLFCKHKWVLLSTDVTRSQFEHALGVIRSAGNATRVNVPWQMSNADRKHIQTFSCEHCGKIKRFVEKI